MRDATGIRQLATTNWVESSQIRNPNRYFGYIALATGCIVLLGLLPLWIGERVHEEYVSEGGALQVFSAAFYLIVSSTIIRESRPGLIASRWHLIAIPILLCLRELDFHTKLTTMTITKTSFYVSPEVPLGEKLLAVAVFVFVGFAAYRTIKLHGREFFAGLRRFDVVAIAIGAAGACAVISKTLDGSVRKLADLGITLAPSLQAPSIIFEEVLELGIPVFLAIAAFAYFSSRSPQGRTPVGA